MKVSPDRDVVGLLKIAEAQKFGGLCIFRGKKEEKIT